MSPASKPSKKAHDEHDHPGLSLALEKKPGMAEVKMTVTHAELERARGREFAQLAQRVTQKGFRAGKTPRVMLEKQFGDEVERTVVEHFVQHGYEKVVEQGSLRPAAYPRIAVDDRMPVKGSDWTLEFEIILRPEFELGQIEGLEIDGQALAVEDDELDSTVVEIRRANSRAEPADDAPLEADGMAVAKLRFFRPDSDESCLEREGIRLSPKTPPTGVDPAAFEEALTGARLGDEREIEMEFSETFPLEEARGEKGRVRIQFTEVMRIVPPTDEELFKAFDAKDEDGFRTSLRAQLLASKQDAEEKRIETALLERVLDEHSMELPQALVDDQVSAQQHELRENLAKSGLAEEEIESQIQSEHERLQAGAQKALKAIYLIEEISRAKELQVTQEDIAGELSSIAERNGTEPAEVAKYYRDEGLLRQLGLELLERKVRGHLRASAVIHAPG